MKIQHLMSQEKSGLATSTLELAKYEEFAGHTAFIRQPTGGLLYGKGGEYDISLAHHQLDPAQYADGKPKFLWNHGEVLSSFGNGISMRATVEMASMCSAFICMRKEELPLWGMIHPNTYLVTKGIDCDVYKPLPGPVERLSGSPAILAYENIRGNRNPMYWLAAMRKVHQKFPNARLHLFNIQDKKHFETLQALNTHSHLWGYLRTLSGPVEGPEEVNKLLSKVDIVVSSLHPLFARSVEAFGAGKAFISPGYREFGYKWTCDYEVDSMADAVIRCWEGYDSVNYRQWALDHHDVRNTVAESIRIYEKFL